MAMKTCNRCGERKSDREFYSNTRGGTNGHCAHCDKRAQRERYRSHSQERRAQVLARYHRIRAEQQAKQSDDETDSATV